MLDWHACMPAAPKARARGGRPVFLRPTAVPAGASSVNWDPTPALGSSSGAVPEGLASRKQHLSSFVRRSILPISSDKV